MNRLMKTSLSAGCIMMRQIMRASSNNIHTYYSERGSCLYLKSPEARESFLHVPIQKKSSITHSCIDEFISSKIAKYKPVWKNKHDLQCRKVMVPGDEVDFVVRIFIRNYSKHIQPAYCILERKETKYSSNQPQHIIVVAPEEVISDVSAQVKSTLQFLYNKMIIKKVFPPENANQNLFIRILVQNHVKNWEEQFKVLLNLRGQGTPSPTEDLAHIAVAGESKRNVEEAASYMKTLMDDISQNLITRKVFLPESENQKFVTKILQNHLNYCQEQFKVLLDLRGQGTLKPTEDLAHVLVTAESEKNVEEAASYMENLIQNISQRLIIRTFFFPENENRNFLCRILAKNHLMNCQEQFKVFLEFRGQGTPSPSDDLPHFLAVAAESERNVGKAASYMENLIQDISRKLITRKVFLPESENQKYISLILTKNHLKNCEEQLKVLLNLRGQGTPNPTEDLGHIAIAAQSEKNIEDAALYMENLIHNISQRLITRKIFLPENENVEFVIRELFKERKDIEENYHLFCDIRGKKKSTSLEDIAHVAVVGESESEIKEAVCYIEHLIKKMQENFNRTKDISINSIIQKQKTEEKVEAVIQSSNEIQSRKIYFPREDLSDINDLYGENGANIEFLKENFMASVSVIGPNSSDSHDCDPYVLVESSCHDELNKAADHIENLVNYFVYG